MSGIIIFLTLVTFALEDPPYVTSWTGLGSAENRYDPTIIAVQARVRDYDKSMIAIRDLLRGWRECDSRSGRERLALV